MNVPARLAVFASAATLTAAAAFAVGAAVDPIAPEEHAVQPAMAGHIESGAPGTATAAPFPTGTPSAAVAPSWVDAPAGEAGLRDPLGLTVSDRGYTLRLADETADRSEGVELSFTIESPDGGPVLNYLSTGGQEMGVIVVRRDLTGFQHVHPERSADGTWSVAVDLADAGPYRLFASFAPVALGEPLTLSADLFVPGEFQPAELPDASTVWSGDGYDVAWTGTPEPNSDSDSDSDSDSELNFSVTHSGADVTDLEPYREAFGDLVTLRAGDLAYVHARPVAHVDDDALGGTAMRFSVAFPTAGIYRLYLTFVHAGSVRTAEFTVEVPVLGGGPASHTGTPIPDPHLDYGREGS